MRTYRLTVAYDGSRFRGWQRQPDTELTVQGILEKAVSKLAGYPVEVNGSGRTDAGVHAAGQTASICLSGKVQEQEFRRTLEELLPEDIRVPEMRLVTNRFHARYSARGKCYEYTVDTGEKADVFTRKYTFHYPRRLDIGKMRKAAEYLVGTHDFAGYTDRKDQDSTVRRIYAILIHYENQKLRIRFQGSGFMYHMVRILTGTLLEVGTGERTPESVRKPIRTGVRQDAGFLAPAMGLCLMEVYYENEDRKGERQG